MKALYCSLAARIKWFLLYLIEVTGLALRSKITWTTWRYALKQYPVAVCGHEHAWVVDPSFR